MKRTVCLLIFTLVFCASSVVSAAVIEFVPPNDPTGNVYTTNFNDGYNSGRGMIFQMSQNVTINSFGIYHDLTNVDLSFEIAAATLVNNFVTIDTVLRSGGSNVTTNGLQWIDYNFSPITLLAGQTYHFEFTHNSIGNQNFFYNNNNVPWDQNGFSFIDGTQGLGASNFVIAAFRVNAEAVPEPSTMLLLGSGLGGLAAFGRKRMKK